MRTARPWSMTAGRSLAAALLSAAAAALFVSIPSASRAEGVVQSHYSLAADGTVTRTGDEKTAKQKYTHVLDVKYRGFLKPVVENELTIKAEWDQGDDAKGFFKLTPELTLKYKGAYWNSGVKRGIEETDEPGKNVKFADRAFIEVVFTPPRPSIPDLKAKYNVDKDYQEDTMDTVKHSMAVSSDYKPFEWLTFRGDWSRGLGYDRLKEDADTEDERFSASVGFRRIVGRNIRFQAEYRVEDARSATLLSGGGTSTSKRDQTHTWKNSIVFRYVPDGTLEASYDYELKERMVDLKDHDLKRTYKVVEDHKFPILGDLALKGTFDRVETETRGRPEGDTLKTEDSWTGEVRSKPSKFFDLSLKSTKKKTRDEAFASLVPPTSTSSFQRSLTWNCDLISFWKTTASVDRTDNFSWSVAEGTEVRSISTTSYTLMGPIVIPTPAIEIAPTYTVTFTDDFLAETLKNTVLRDFTTKLTSTFVKTRKGEAKIEHTYARKEDTKIGNIVRTDTSILTMALRDAFPGWNFDASLTRNATDTSGDDLGVDVTEGATLKAELKRDPFRLGFTYKYDRTLTEGKYDKYNIDVQTGWTVARWDVNLTGSYKKTLSPVVDQGTTLNLTFNYQL